MTVQGLRSSTQDRQKLDDAFVDPLAPTAHQQQATTRTSSRDRQPSTSQASRDPAALTSSSTKDQIDSDLLAFVQTKAPPKPNDRVLYVGMNDDSANGELASLRSTGASVSAVVLRHDGANVTLNNVDYNLSKDDACASFAHALASKHRLTPEAERQIAAALLSVKPANARDELAQVAMTLAPGENGASIPSRIVLSGHSAGREVYFHSDALTFDSILALGRALPAAAKQIEDVHLSGCFTEAAINDHPAWVKAFPNLKTMWGYSSVTRSLEGHLQTWEANTRGHVASDPAKGLSGTATWSARDGIREPGVTLKGLKEDLKSADNRFFDHYLGKTEHKTPHGGLIEIDYATYRRLASRPELAPAERAGYAAKADVLFRMRFYDTSVRGEFAKAYGAPIARAFTALGLKPVDFASLSRTEALSAIDQFEQRVTTSSKKEQTSEIADAARALRGLRVLDQDTIPQAWLHE